LNQVDGDNISLYRPSVVILKVDRNNVKKIEKIGHDALITLDSGEKIIINQFFNDGTYHSENSLVFDDGESKLIWVQFTDENGALLENITYNYIDSIDPLLYQDDGTASPLAWAFIPTAAAGILWWANDSDNDYVAVAPPTKPATPEGFIDNEGDKTGTFPGGTETDDTTPGMIIGPIEAGEIPKLIVDGQEVESTYDPDTGTLTPVDPLPEGQHEIGFTVTDPKGNESEVSDPIIVIVDTTPPAKPTAPESFVDNEGKQTGTFPGGTETDDTTPGIIIGPIEAGEIPKLIVDGQEVESTYDPDTGTLTPVDPLPEGQHEIGFTVTDPAGNESEVSDPIIVIVDTTPPAKPTAPEGFIDNEGDKTGTFPGGTETDDTTPGIIIGPIEAGEIPKLIVDGQEVESVYDPDTGTLTPVDPLAEGEHEIGFTVTDPAGNESDVSDPIIVIVDTIPPAKPTAPESFIDNEGKQTGTFPGGTETDDTTPGIIIGPIEAGETPKLIVDGQEVESTYDPDTGTLTPVNPLPEGQHEIGFTVTDPAGNESEVSDPIIVIVDTTSPAKPTAPESFVDNEGKQTGTFPGGTETDDTTPGMIIGPIEAGEIPKLIVDGQEVESTYDPDTGTLTPANPLPEGQHEIGFTVTDPAGNESEVSDPIIVIVDTTPPAKPTAPESFVDNEGKQTGTFPDGTETDDTTPGMIIGPIEVGETPKLIVDGQEVESVYDPDTGTLTPVDPLAEGEHEIGFTVTDPAGNESEVSDPIIVIVDTTPPVKPTAPESFVDNEGDKTGTFPGGSETDDTTPGIIIGPIEAGETPKLIVDGQEVESVYDPDTGTLTPVNPLPEGQHEIGFTITDPAGNESEVSDPIIVIVDTTPPVKPTSPESFVDNNGKQTGTFPGGSETDDTTPGIIIGPIEVGETPKLIVDGQEVESTYDPDTGTLTPVNPLPEGQHEIGFTVTDPAGNESEVSDPIIVIVDTTPPVKPTAPESFIDNEGKQTGTFPGGTETDDTTPGIIIGPIEAGEIPKLIVDGQEVESVYDPDTGTLTPVNPLAEGEHEIGFTVTDPAGNESEVSDPIIVIVDTTPPVKPTAPESFVDNEGDKTGIFPGGTETDDTTPGIIIGPIEAGETPKLIVDGQEVESTYDPDTGTLTPVNPLPEGQHEIGFTVTDPAGNESEVSDPIIVIVDTTAPNVLRIDSVIDDVEFITGELSPGDYTNDRHPTVNGSGAEAHALIILKDTNGQILGTTTADAIGHWRVEPDTGKALTDGLHNLQVTQTDQAGNESPVVSFELNVDATAPTQSTTITGIEDDQSPVTGNVVHQGYTDDRTPTLKGSISAALGANEKVVILRDGVVIGEATVTGTDWNYTDSGLLDGTQYQYTARVEDSAGNRGGDSNGYIINIDSSVPTQSITIQSVTDNFGPVQGDLNSGATTDDSTPTLNGTVSGQFFEWNEN
ncbi:Ig-like domain-containing protein, partial [Acinetobacter gerneri]|uniref:Ig-like domain-containing protein n=1 Tax=Acinetobacter gerneri TaxID=202952 RepID=UPI0032135110